MRIDSYVVVKTMMDKGFKNNLTLEQIFGKNINAIKWCEKYLKLKEEFYKTGKISFEDVGIDKEVIKTDFKTLYNHIDSNDIIDNCIFLNYKWLFYDFAKMRVMEYTDGYINYYFCPDTKYYDYDIARHEYYYHLFHGFWDKIDKWHHIRDNMKRMASEIEYHYVEKLMNLDEIKNILLKNYNKISDFEKEFEKRNKINYETLVNNSIMRFKDYLSNYKEESFPLMLSTKYINEKIDETINEKKCKSKHVEETYKNSRFNSKDEKILYQKLCNKFGKDNVLKEYRSAKYPWNCDFYIKNKELFIEYQGTWSHFASEWVGSMNQKLKGLQIYDKCSGKAKNRYISAIKNWTITDSAKRKWAKDNNLNWKEFFTIEEMNKWIESA